MSLDLSPSPTIAPAPSKVDGGTLQNATARLVSYYRRALQTGSATLSMRHVADPAALVAQTEAAAWYRWDQAVFSASSNVTPEPSSRLRALARSPGLAETCEPDLSKEPIEPEALFGYEGGVAQTWRTALREWEEAAALVENQRDAESFATERPFRPLELLVIGRAVAHRLAEARDEAERTEAILVGRHLGLLSVDPEHLLLPQS